MILTAGLTPAWQQILVFDAYRHGEVNRAAEAVWAASGKVLNAGCAAHHLGGRSLTLAAVGGPALEQTRREFDELGIGHRLIETAAATRVCTTVLDRSTGTITELVENGRPISGEELDAFRKAYLEEVVRAEVVVLIGSLPAGTPATFYGELLEKTECPAIIDAQGEPLLAALAQRPLLVKPNREELGNTLGESLENDEQLVAAMKSVNRRGASWVLVSDGARAVWLSSSQETYRLHPPKIQQLVNPIGCGDAMCGAMAWAIRDGRDMADAAKLAIGAACNNLEQLLPCRLNLARALQWAEQVRVERLDG